MALNIPGGEFLTGSLDVISQSLTIPVLIILLVIVIATIILLGGAIAEYTYYYFAWWCNSRIHIKKKSSCWNY